MLEARHCPFPGGCRCELSVIDNASPSLLSHHLLCAVMQAVVHVTSPTTGKRKVLVPEIFTKRYAKVIPHDVAAKEAVCLTSDVAVLGHASIKGDTCITGNVLIAGNLQAAGGICVTGDAVVLGGAHLEGQVTVTGDAFVGGDLAVRGKLEVGGKLCVFGSKDIQPQR